MPQVAAYLALGCSMFVSLLLQGFGSRIFPLAACAAALALEIAYRHSGCSGRSSSARTLLAVLTGYAAFALGSAARHAC